MALVDNPKSQPAPEATQNARVIPGSPLAIIGLFVEVIRRRFTANNGLPWVYDPDIKKTQISIESAFVESNEARNFRPAIFVDRDDSTPGRTVVGDRAGLSMPNMVDGFWALMTVPISIECVAAKRGESAIIGDIVQFYLHSSSDLIQAKFGLHEMMPVVLGKTQPFERDEAIWATPITFSIQFPIRWSQAPIRPILRELIADIQGSGVESATEFFEKIVLSPTQK